MAFALNTDSSLNIIPERFIPDLFFLLCVFAPLRESYFGSPLLRAFVPACLRTFPLLNGGNRHKRGFNRGDVSHKKFENPDTTGPQKGYDSETGTVACELHSQWSPPHGLPGLLVRPIQCGGAGGPGFLKGNDVAWLSRT